MLMKEEQEEPPNNGQPRQQFRFNLDNTHLSCFISKRPLKIKSRDKKPINANNRGKEKMPKHLLSKYIQPWNEHTSPYFGGNFNHKVLFTHYGQDEVYVDCQGGIEQKSEQTTNKVEEEIVVQCVRVLTEETSDKLSQPEPTNNPQESIKFVKKYSDMRSSMKIRQIQFQIDLLSVERDGRTTIMLRNIPNKYTQQMILQEIDQSGLQKRYNFFYLPIDYKNDCNVGYAFINLIHTQFIHQLHHHFHGKKWRRFNSEKICEVCYARLQGTQQLMSHFRYSSVFNQKQWRPKPIIYMNMHGDFH